MDRLHNDIKYVTEKEDLYGFRIVFQSKIIEGLNKKYNEDVLKILKPIYPWKKEILDTYKIDLIEMEVIKKENKKLKKENEDNKDTIKKLVKELEELKKST
jgi:FtsZ-binding cell division protein ZapB